MWATPRAPPPASTSAALLFSIKSIVVINPFANFAPRMRIEQTACTHHAAHLPKAGHRNDEAQNIRLHPRPDRRVEKAQKTPPAAVAVLLHGLRHDRAAPRPEGRRHGVRRIVVERRPRHQSRQRIGRREKRTPSAPSNVSATSARTNSSHAFGAGRRSRAAMNSSTISGVRL